MIHYDKNVSIVIDTMRKYQYSSQSINDCMNCYNRLRETLISNHESIFLKENAILLAESIATGRIKGFYFPAINRLADVYEYGHVLGGHLKIGGQLVDCFKNAVDDFDESLNLCDGYIHNLTASSRHFCAFIQCNGVFSFSEITYGVIDSYRTFVSELKGHYNDYISNASRFLKYLSSIGLLEPGLSLYLNSRYTPKCISLDDMSPEYKNIVEKFRFSADVIPRDNFYRSIKDFSEQLKPFGYCDNLISYTSFYLKLLYVFLDRSSLGYNRKIADAWLESMEYMHFSKNRYNHVRRALDLYDDFIKTGNSCPLIRPRHLESAYARLPLWCKERVDSFLSSKKKEGRADGSIRQFKSQVSIFCEYLVSKGLTSFEELTPEIAKSFTNYNSHILPRTRNSYNRGAEQFLVHMEMYNLVKQGIHMALTTNKANYEKIVTVLSKDDRFRILTYCATASTPIALRDAAILLLGINTALRACDILALTVDNIDWKKHTIKVIQNKTSVEHTHYVDVETLNAVFRYMKYARPKNAESNKIFISIRAPYTSLTSAVCNDALKRAGSSVLDFHRLRRTYATDSLIGGATLEETSELLGQSDTRSLHKYTALDDERMRLCSLSLADTGLSMEVQYN